MSKFKGLKLKKKIYLFEFIMLKVLLKLILMGFVDNDNVLKCWCFNILSFIKLMIYYL